MTESLFSPHWYRIKGAHPRLRAQVRVLRQHWRGQRWYLLSDDASGRQHRINEAAYQFIGRCDGRHTVQQIWDGLLARLGDDAPTQHDIIELLIRLNELELMQTDRPLDMGELFKRRDDRRSSQRRLRANPFALRMPLMDPSPWLERLDPLAHAIFRPGMFWLWLAAMLLAILATASEWDAITAHAAHGLFSPGNLALMWLAFPLMKTVHELAHALAIRRWGGEVHEVGIALLVLVPAPYVDASEAASFPRRMQRAMVGLAGIFAELTMAALALLVWLNVEAGLTRDFAFVVMFIGTVSTLLFNGNPLLRFDAYYVLSDLLDVPNLAPRSQQLWNHLLRHHLLRTRSEAPPMAPGEYRWLLGYTPLSLAYRLALTVVIVLWLGSQWFMLGLLAGLYLLFATIVRPLYRWIQISLQLATPGPESRRARLGLLALFGLPGLLLFVLPMPLSSVAPAVVWLPEQAQVRSDVDGFISALPVPDGSFVTAGQVILVLENDTLQVERDSIASQLQALQADHYQSLRTDPTAAQNLAEEIDRMRGELARADERLDQRIIRARTDGTLVIPHQADLPGRFIKRGETIGHILQREALIVRAAVPQDDIFLIRNRTQSIEVSLAEHPRARFAATMTHDTPASTRQLPSPALGEPGGGPHPVDPADQNGTQTLAPLFLIDLKLEQAQTERIGGRAWVRFDHGTEPLAAQLHRLFSQLFLKHFNPST